MYIQPGVSYNTTLYDDADKQWKWDRVNDSSETCYIKYSKNYYSYIQSTAHMNEQSFGHPGETR